MKKFSLFTVLAVFALGSSLLFNSCEQAVDTNFEKGFSNITFVVPVYPNTIDTTIANFDVTTNINDFAAISGFTLTDIKSCKIKSCDLFIDDTTTQFTPVTFDIVDHLSATLATGGVAKEIASKDVVHNSATQVSLDIKKDVDVTEFIKADNFTYKLNAKTNAGTDHVVPMHANITFSLVATVKSK